VPIERAIRFARGSRHATGDVAPTHTAALRVVVSPGEAMPSGSAERGLFGFRTVWLLRFDREPSVLWWTAIRSSAARSDRALRSCLVQPCGGEVRAKGVQSADHCGHTL